MLEFYHENSNCHDTYVNLVNDKLAAITFSTPEELGLVVNELKSLETSLVQLDTELSVTEFIANTSYQTSAINELLELIDPDMGYVYPNHVKPFIQKILKERIKAFHNDAAKAGYLQANATKSKNKKRPLVFTNSRRLIVDKIRATYQIHEHTLKPEFNLILKIVLASNLITNGYSCEPLLEEIFDNLGLHRNVGIPDDYSEDSEILNIEAISQILLNMKNLLDASVFTIQKILTLDIEARWFLIMSPHTILGDDNNQGIDVINAEEKTLQTFITCKQLLTAIEKGEDCTQVIMYLFQDLGIPQNSDEFKPQLEMLYSTIAAILVPFSINLQEYSSFDASAINVALTNYDNFEYAVLDMQLCPVKLLQLSHDTLFEIFDSHENIELRCEQAGITLSELISLPKDEVAMILNTKYFIERLPVLTRAYFLQPQLFLDASLQQKQAWLEHPASAKLRFNSQSLSLAPTELKEALRAINIQTAPILHKLAATEALLYLTELAHTPWDIVLELQNKGLNYSQCRVIFKALISINNLFVHTFIGRFTNENSDLFSKIYTTFAVNKINALLAGQEIESYIEALRAALEATKDENLPQEFSDLVASKEQSEIIDNMANSLYENNIFCKHLRLYKKTNHENLLTKLSAVDIHYVRARYSDGDINIFSMLCSETLDCDQILSEFQAIAYDARNTQELSVFGYAVETDNIELIEKISTSIKRRSKKDIQQFLSENRFKRSLSPNILFAYNSKMPFDSSAINAVHPDTGDTPLLTAIRQGNSTIALGLIAWGADLKVRDAAGQTPEMLAEKLDVGSIVHDLYYKDEYSKLLAIESESTNSVTCPVRL